ncbi:MAG: hypothetical protein HQM14_18520 [SAR324 cluster bacterium]|nr:hypothetical protein [SAR324 cluster bacterium]
MLAGCGDVASEINGLNKILGVEEKDTAKGEDDDESSIIVGDDDLLTGIFVDAAVDGITYTGSGASGITDSNGTFKYKSGTSVTFSIGGITLGTATGQSLITPLEAVGTNDAGNQQVVNMLRLLQTLDDDGIPENGITITEAVRAQAANQTVDFNQTTTNFDTNTTAAIASLTSVRSSGTTALVSVSSAVSHFSSTVSSLGISISSSPVDISLSASSVIENQASGNTVGSLNSADADGETQTYSLVSSTGSTDNSSFSI